MLLWLPCLDAAPWHKRRELPTLERDWHAQDGNKTHRLMSLGISGHAGLRVDLSPGCGKEVLAITSGRHAVRLSHSLGYIGLVLN